MMWEWLHEVDKENSELKQRIKGLEAELKSALKDESVNVEQVAAKLAEEKIRQKKALWDEEKEMILRDLQNRVDKVVWLEISLDEAWENNWWLEA